MSNSEAPRMGQLLEKLKIKRWKVFFLQPGKDQIKAVFPDMEGMTARILTIDFAIACGRRYIIVPFHCHPFGGGRAPKTKLYSLRLGCCNIVVFRDGGFDVRCLVEPFDKELVNPGEWHAMIFDTKGAEIDVTLSAKDDVPPCWTDELDGLLASNPTTA